VDFVTDTITLEASSLQEPASLRLEAEIHTPRIRRSGNVPVTIRIHNEGNSALHDIILTEPALGEIRSFAVIPAGGEIVRHLDVQVDEDMQLQFRADYTDTDGWLRHAETEAMQIVIAADGILPEGSKIPLIEFTGTSVKIGGSALFGVLLIAATVVLIILTVILLIASRRAKLEKQLRIAAERQRRKEEMGKTNRFKPIRKKK